MGRGNPIPTAVRLAIDKRDRRQCLRCGGAGREIHHRQRRREGGHGLENTLLLCSACHRWAHAHPSAAREQGFIVSAFAEEIEQVPVVAYYGTIWLDAEGGVRWA